MPSIEKPTAEIDFSHYLDVVFRRRWVLLSVFFISVAVSILIAFTRTPIYQASALLIIEKEQGGNTAIANGSFIESSNEDYYNTRFTGELRCRM